MSSVINPGVAFTPLFKTKAANEGVTNSAVYQDDDDIASISYVANQKYFLIATLQVSPGSATSGLKAQLVASNATMYWSLASTYITGGATVIVPKTTTGASLGLNNNILDSANPVHIAGYLMDTAAGTLKLQFSQWSAEANTSYLNKGSSLMLLPVS